MGNNSGGIMGTGNKYANEGGGAKGGGSSSGGGFTGAANVFAERARQNRQISHEQFQTAGQIILADKQLKGIKHTNKTNKQIAAIKAGSKLAEVQETGKQTRKNIKTTGKADVKRTEAQSRADTERSVQKRKTNSSKVSNALRIAGSGKASGRLEITQGKTTIKTTIAKPPATRKTK